MALASNPFGFKPVSHLKGGVIRPREYKIASGLAANIGQGDMVKSTGTTRQITLAAATDAVLGCFWGCRYVDSTGQPKWSRNWPTGTVLATGTECIALVYDDPGILFQVMSAAVANIDLGADANLNAGAGVSSMGISGQYVDSSTGSAVQWKVYNIPPFPYRNSTGGYELGAAGSFVPVEVYAMKHELAGTAAGVFV